MVLHGDAQAVSTTSRCIKAGDLVIVYERFDSMKSVYVTPGESFGNRFGNFKLKDWVGKPFGSRVESSGRGSTGWVYLLAPTPELWTTVLKHRTQILYVADISMICTFLELKPGCIVLESGTGSGSLTHSLARAIAPTGHVHTFEFHQPRAEAADKEFKEHGMGDIITTTHRNIEELGFPEELHGKADGLFLDLPGPWHAVASAAQCLRPDGVFCSFSPCIEQVQRTCAALEEQGFFAVRTMECLLRHYEVRQENMASIDEIEGVQQHHVSAKRKRQQEFQSRKRQAMTAAADPILVGNNANGGSPAPAASGQVSAATDVPEPSAISAASTSPMLVDALQEPWRSARQQPEQQPVPGDNARQKVQAGLGATSHRPVAEVNGNPNSTDSADAQVSGTSKHALTANPASQLQSQQAKTVDNTAGHAVPKYVVAKPVNEARGHTGYLTFARRSVDD